jgi:hypothetical protein
MASALQLLAAKKRTLFLSALSECGNVTKAAKTAGVTPQRLYQYRKTDEAFAAEWDECAELGAQALEDEARRRAYEGVEEPVTSVKGIVHNDDGSPLYVRKYSDTLLIFLLKGARPQKYRERADVKLSGQLDINGLAAEADARFYSLLAATATPEVLGKPDASAEG